MFGMSSLEMIVLPFLGIAMVVLFSLPWFWVTTISPKMRGSEAGGRQWKQFSLRSFMLWIVPLVAITCWILSWDGPFFTKRSVLSQKAAALNVFVLVTYWTAFLWSVRKYKLRQSPQGETRNQVDP
jgi:hypothetical protein